MAGTTERENRRRQGSVSKVEQAVAEKKPIKVAIIGVGNCASSLVQGVTYYKDALEDQRVPGLMHVNLGGYHVRDIQKSQVGATITHRLLTRLFEDRGVRLDRTYQLNFGGNTDFMNMLERERLESKKISKTNAVTSQFGFEMPANDAHAGPSDYVPWLNDRKWAYIRMEGTTFGDVPLNVEVKLEVWDSPNSAGVVIDAIRCAKLALNHKIGGSLTAPSAYYMKSPAQQFTDDEAHQMLQDYIRAHALPTKQEAPTKPALAD